MTAIGDICRAKCSAPARYLGGGKCLFVSSMCNALCVDDARPATGGESALPLPTDAEVAEHAEGVQ